MGYSFPTAQPEIVAEGDAEEIQGQSVWPLGSLTEEEGDPADWGSCWEISLLCLVLSVNSY